MTSRVVLALVLPLIAALQVPPQTSRRCFTASAISLLVTCPNGRARAAEGSTAQQGARPPVSASNGDDEARRVGGDGVRAVLATPEELARLQAEAAVMELPSAPKGSDLDRFLNGEVSSSSSSSSPLAHGR